ncbi:hypothetical protein KCP77_23320 [Salmonella enterica subsp. enterica]|nr:hypothetical protein KCP77_23320 [Salmonella enterica subsp. enterica]
MKRLPIIILNREFNHDNITFLNDELVDMKFITKYSKLTDKMALIKRWRVSKPIKLGRSSRWLRRSVRPEAH